MGSCCSAPSGGGGPSGDGSRKASLSSSNGSPAPPRAAEYRRIILLAPSQETSLMHYRQVVDREIDGDKYSDEDDLAGDLSDPERSDFIVQNTMHRASQVQVVSAPPAVPVRSALKSPSSSLTSRASVLAQLMARQSLSGAAGGEAVILTSDDEREELLSAGQSVNGPLVGVLATPPNNALVPMPGPAGPWHSLSSVPSPPPERRTSDSSTAPHSTLPMSHFAALSTSHLVPGCRGGITPRGTSSHNNDSCAPSSIHLTSFSGLASQSAASQGVSMSGEGTEPVYDLRSASSGVLSVAGVPMRHASFGGSSFGASTSQCSASPKKKLVAFNLEPQLAEAGS